MTKVLRRDLTRDLTPDEVDDMFDELYGRLAAAESAISDAENPFDPITPFIVSGDTFSIKMADATVFGPFDLPAIQWNPRGAWVPDTAYARHDIFTAIGNLYETIFATAGQSSFDPDANDGLGHDFYRLILPSFTLSHVSENADDVIDLTGAMANTFFECTAAAGTTVNISFDFVAALDPDSEIHFVAAAAGAVMFVAENNSAAEVTLKMRSGRLAMTAALGSAVTLKKIGDATVRLIGDLAIDDGSSA